VADLQEHGACQEGESKRRPLHAAQTSPKHPHVRFDVGWINIKVMNLKAS